MISPSECASQFNRVVRRASDSTINYQDRILSWCQAQVYYYCLTGTSLSVNLNEYLSNYGLTIDSSNFSREEVENTSGERLNRPIRRFLNMLFPKF